MSWYERIVTEASQLEQRKLLQFDILKQRALSADPINWWAVSLAQVKSREILIPEDKYAKSF